MASLRDEYINNSPEILKLYSKPLESLFSSPPIAAPWNQELIDAIRKFNKDLGHSPDFNGSEAVIITGQQPAVFAGPLYSVYKAVTTIKLAEKLSKIHKTPCVPVFWVGSEDHDFDEAATIYFPTKKHITQSLTLHQHPDESDCALHQVTLTEQIHDLIDIMADSVNATEFHDEISTFLHDSARMSTSLADWSTRCLARLFRNTPLIFFSPHLQAARNIGASIISTAIRNPLETSKCVNAGAQALETLGYDAQVVKNNDECAFFINTDSRRHKVTHDGSNFHLPDNNESFSQDQLLDKLKKNPEHFSPNVALRCVIQQTLFPVAAYVAGPGELAYWGQFKAVFDLFDKPMPVVFPRAEAVLTTMKNNKLLKKYGLSISELTNSKEELIQKALRSVTQSTALTHTRENRVQMINKLSDLILELEKDTPVAAAMAEKLSSDLERKLDRLENTILQSDTQKKETVTNHINRLCECLAPQKKPQERMHTIFAYLFEHGWGLMDTLLDEITIESSDLFEVEL